jgi:hypothetical protein
VARSARRPGSVSLEPHRLQPPALAQGVQGEEPPLRPAQPVRVPEEPRSEEPRSRHRPQLPGGGLDLHRVTGKRLPGVLDGEALGREPQRGFLARELWEETKQAGPDGAALFAPYQRSREEREPREKLPRFYAYPFGYFDFKWGGHYIEREVHEWFSFPAAEPRTCGRCGTSDLDWFRQRYTPGKQEEDA